MGCPVVTYNGYTLPNVYGPYSFSQTPTDLQFSCNFLIKGSSSAALISDESTMVAALKTVKGAFAVSFNSATEYNLSHGVTNGTGFNARATAIKIADANLSLATCRAYKFSINLELPYTQDNGRIKADMSISYLPSRQAVVDFTILYSASSTQNALTVYAADTWPTTTIAALFTGGEIFELVSESRSQDQNQKRATVHLKYKQVLFPVSLDATIENKVVDAILNYSLNFVTAVNSMITSAGENLPLLELSLSYQGHFNKTLTASVNDMATAWQTNLRGRLISQATAILKTATYNYTTPSYYIKNEHVNINPSTYSVSASMKIGCKATGTHVVSLTERLQIITDEGIRYVKLWDGKPNTFAMWSLGSVKMLMRSVSMTQLETQPVIPVLPPNYGLSSGQWIKLKQSPTYEQSFEGVRFSGGGADGGAASKVTIYRVSVSEQYLCVDTANSITTLIGAIGGQTTTPSSSYGG